MSSLVGLDNSGTFSGTGVPGFHISPLSGCSRVPPPACWLIVCCLQAWLLGTARVHPKKSTTGKTAGSEISQHPKQAERIVIIGAHG